MNLNRLKPQGNRFAPRMQPGNATLETEEPPETTMISRYRAQFGIPMTTVVTKEMIIRHWQVETSLARNLQDSTPENRWRVFEHCYTEFYAKLADLNELWWFDSPAAYKEGYADWAHLIGKSPKIYEIGSGKGGLIRYLAERGHECKGTEISRERGEKWVEPHPQLSWGVSDGVNLDQFEPANSYDVLISNQVVEHLHPDDLVNHFRGALTILRPGGRYIFDTPHAFCGPSDISRVFGCDTPQGFHLKEYTWREIVETLRQAGFVKVYAVLSFPRRIRRLFRGYPYPVRSRVYLLCLLVLEALIGSIPFRRLRSRAAIVAMKAVRFSGIRVVAERGRS